MQNITITLFEAFDEEVQLQNLGPWNLCNGTIIKNIYAQLIDYEGGAAYSKLGNLSFEAPNQIKIKLKDNLMFSNGLDIKGSDIIWSLKRAIRLKALRHEIFKNNSFDIYFDNDNTLILKTSNHQESILDELTAIAYSIFPESSLNDKHLIPLNTPTSGKYRITSCHKNAIELTSNTNKVKINKITILPTSLLKKHPNIFSQYPNAILRTTRSYTKSLNDHSLDFHKIGDLYQYLLPNTASKFKDENIDILAFLHKALNRYALCQSINNKYSIDLTGISTLDPNPHNFTLSTQSTPKSLQNIHKILQKRTVFKIYGGFSQVGKELILEAIEEAINSKSINFCFTDIKDDADFVFMGHMFNENFPLKSLPYFFGEEGLLNLNNKNLISMKKFLNKHIIPFQSDITISHKMDAFNKLNLEKTVLLPLFKDELGYACKKELQITLEQPKLLHDWSEVSK